MSSTADIEILDVTDTTTFELLPPCADPRFDHRSCDYWEDGVRGSKSARPTWWQRSAPRTAPKPRPRSDNPFAPAPREGDGFNPFAPAPSGPDALGGEDLFGTPDFNPFAPATDVDEGALKGDAPRKLRLLGRGRAVFGSYAKVLLQAGTPAVYAQFGPLSAYPRAQHVRELYPRLPSSPLPAVITCVATTSTAQDQGLAQALVAAIAGDLAARGFAAIEAYPDLTLEPAEASAATPAFWESCGFGRAIADERFPVMRRELE